MEILPENPKILVIRLSSLGDIILTAPVLRNLKARWPLSRIDLLVKPQFAAAASNSAFISGTVEFTGLLKTKRALKRVGYDLIIDLHANLRSRLLYAMVKAPFKIRYRKDSLARELFVNFRVPSPALEKHTLERYLETLAPIGVPVKYPGPVLGDWDIARETAGGGAGEKSEVRSQKSEVRPINSDLCPLTSDLRPLPAVGVTPVKFCVFQSAFLGDCVLTLPLLKKLKEIKPDASITVLTRPETAGIFSSSGFCAEVLTDNKKTASLAGEFFRLVRELKSRKFDAALIPHRSLRTAMLARAAGIPLRSGFSTSAGSFLLTHKAPFSWLLHDAERNLTLLSPFMGSVDSGQCSDTVNNNCSLATVHRPLSQSRTAPEARDRSEPQSRTAPEARDRSEPQSRTVCLRRNKPVSLARFAPDEKVLIGVNAGSAWFTKRWPKERWAELIKKLAFTHRSRIMMVGSPGEATWNNEIERRAGSENCLDLTGKTDISELMALIAGLKLFITNDSGPMHIAAALGVPVAAIFGPTTKELGFFPYGEKMQVIETTLKCRPCALHGSNECPRGHFLCMKLITADKVFDAAERLYEASASELQRFRNSGDGEL